MITVDIRVLPVKMVNMDQLVKTTVPATVMHVLLTVKMEEGHVNPAKLGNTGPVVLRAVTTLVLPVIFIGYKCNKCT